MQTMTKYKTIYADPPWWEVGGGQDKAWSGQTLSAHENAGNRGDETND